MSVYMFGWQRCAYNQTDFARLKRIAKRHGCGVNLVHGNSGHCNCGRNCGYGMCRNVMTWFYAPNRGDPFDRELAARVDADVKADHATR